MTAAVRRNSCFLRRLVSANVFPVVPPLLSSPALVHKYSRLDRVVFKVFKGAPNVVTLYDSGRFSMFGSCWTHRRRWCSNKAGGVIELAKSGDGGNAAENVGAGDGKLKRKKLKGKRAVVRWLKFFRYKKKKEYERMTAEEKILYKLKKARKKEERLVESLKKIEPAEKSETTHDPEILTPEEHFFFLKMGLKSKNYVPLGRRGIYQGVILNMHLHWKKHQTLQVVVKTFSPEEVKEIAAELARLTGGIILDIHEENTIIMYRGKNYCQPPTEIMSPRVTLSRRKALDKSKYRDGLRAVRKYIPRLEQDLGLLQAQNRTKREERNTDVVGESRRVQSAGEIHEPEKSVKLKEILSHAGESLDDDVSSLDLSMPSDSEDLSDIFETESESESEDKTGDGHNILLDAFDKLPANNGSDTEDFEDHLREMYTADSITAGKQSDSPKFDEVDRMFLRSASLLKKHRR